MRNKSRLIAASGYQATLPSVKSAYNIGCSLLGSYSGLAQQTVHEFAVLSSDVNWPGLLCPSDSMKSKPCFSPMSPGSFSIMSAGGEPA